MLSGNAMLLAAIGTDGHLYASIKKAAVASIRKAFDAFVNQIQVHLNPLPDGGLCETNHDLNTLVRRGCG
jgi:hypothetical protein